MDQFVNEWNGRIVYYAIFGVLALGIAFLFFRHYRRQRRLECTHCGRALYGRARHRDVVGGSMKTFCDGKCADDFRKNGALSASERQVRRAEELMES